MAYSEGTKAEFADAIRGLTMEQLLEVSAFIRGYKAGARSVGS